MELFLKLAAIIVISAILITVLRRDLPSVALVLSLVALAVVFGACRDIIASVISVGQDIAKLSSVSERQLSILLKVLAITILTKITGDFCKDAGCNGLAGTAEIVGNLVAVIAAAPLLEELIGFLSSI